MFFYENHILFPAKFSLNCFYFFENILYNSFPYSFLSNLKEYFCNFLTVHVVNLFVPGSCDIETLSIDSVLNNPKKQLHARICLKKTDFGIGLSKSLSKVNFIFSFESSPF